MLDVSGFDVSVRGRSLFTGVDLRVNAGEAVAVMGPSGSGKTSLLNAIAGIVPARGSVVLDGVDLSVMGSREREGFRLRSIGLVFQDSDLLPELSVIENAELPARLLGVGQGQYRAQARSALTRVGMADREDAWPSELSGGERQRVAIARALSNDPALVLADEPTGALDRDNAEKVTQLLVHLAHEANKIVLIATHDDAVARCCDTGYRCEQERLEPLHAITG